MKSVKCVMLASALALSVLGCKEESPSTPTKSAAGHSHGLPANLKLTAAPENPREVAAARAALKDGDRVVIQGIVGGRTEPIAANRAILTLMDNAIETCDKNPKESCSTPWDACCEPPEVRAKNSITIQVVDAKGHLLQTSLGSLEGVKPLARLSIVGTAKVTADGAMLVNAEGIYVVK